MTINELTTIIKIFQRELDEKLDELAREQLDDEEKEEEEVDNG